MQAVMLVRSGWSTRKVARHLGFSQSVIVKWVKRAPQDGRKTIPTKSSRPHAHPKALAREIVSSIIKQRLTHRRCAEVVHKELSNQGIAVSLSSVKRTLKRSGLTKERSPWKRFHRSQPRPEAFKPGDLIQIDTIHIMSSNKERFYIYTLIDVYSRWAYAKVVSRINTHQSRKFILEAQAMAPFKFQTLQSDHGPEFSSWFTEHVQAKEMNHRHSRIRQPNDNAHVERFNRTLQEEGLYNVPNNPHKVRYAVSKFIPYYNTERLHLSLNLQTPLQVIPSY